MIFCFRTHIHSKRISFWGKWSKNQRWANDSAFRGIPYSVFRVPRKIRGTENEIQNRGIPRNLLNGKWNDFSEFPQRQIKGWAQLEFHLEFLPLGILTSWNFDHLEFRTTWNFEPIGTLNHLELRTTWNFLLVISNQLEFLETSN